MTTSSMTHSHSERGRVMSLFDELKVEYPLAEREVQGHLFQTKDLECSMSTYTITKEGRLIHHRRFDDWGVARTKDMDVDTEYHGDISFGTHTGSYNDGTQVVYEYVARFTEGQLQWIKRYTPEITA